MSMDLYWQPIQPTKGELLSRAMKYALARHLWDHDGTLGGGPTVLNGGDVMFLKGMRAAGGKEVKQDCDRLLQAIEKYGSIEVWIE